MASSTTVANRSSGNGKAIAPPSLADQINAEHVACQRAHDQAVVAAGTAVQHAIKCGGLLCEQKNKILRGSWEQWAKDHLTFSLRTAQEYMRFYRDREKIEAQRAAPQTLRQATRLIAGPSMPAVEVDEAEKWPDMSDTLDLTAEINCCLGFVGDELAIAQVQRCRRPEGHHVRVVVLKSGRYVCTRSPIKSEHVEFAVVMGIASGQGKHDFTPFVRHSAWIRYGYDEAALELIDEASA